MIDGTYDVEARTPLGTKAGRLTLATSGSACTCALTLGDKTAHLEGTVAADVVTFTGSVNLPFPLGKQDYELTGTVQGDTLTGTCRTRKFSFDIVGRRVA